MKKILLIVLILFFVGCYEDGNSPDEEDSGLQYYKPGNAVTVVILGDSRIWEGREWKHLPYTIYNYAYPGTTTYGAYLRFKRIHFVPDVVVIGTGVNDIRMHGFEIFREYYDLLVDSIHDDTEIVCLEVTEPNNRMLIDDTMNDYLLDTYGNSYLELNILPEETRDSCHFKESTFVRISELIEKKIESIMGK